MTTLTKTININVKHRDDTPVVPHTDGDTNTTTSVPNTGYNTTTTTSNSSLAIQSTILLMAIATLTVIGCVILVFNRRFKKQHRVPALLSGISMIALSLGLFLPVLHNATLADSVTIEVGDEDTVATTTLDIKTEEDYPYGYVANAYVAPTNALTNTISPSAIIPSTSSAVTSADQLSSNTWGIKDSTSSIVALSDNAAVPTLLINTGDATSAGTTVNIPISFKLNNTLAEGDYKGGTIEVTLTAKETPTPTGTFTRAYQDAGKIKDATTGYYKMQDMTNAICAAVDTPSSATAGDEQTATLVDTRKGNTYTVSKLMDGNCWMTQNLELGQADDVTELTPDDSDVSNTTTIPASSSNWSYSDTSTPRLYYDGSNTGTGKTEIFYNWSSATAGTNNTSGSVCPKGWKLPTGGSTGGQFIDLDNLYNRNYTAFKTAFKPAFAGTFSPSSRTVINQNVDGYWWSSSIQNASLAYYLFVDYDSVAPNNNYNRSYGYSVRCIAR